MIDMIRLTEMEFDALKEIGNIGAGHIATSLSKMLGKDVEINIPDTRFIGIDGFADYLGGPERIASAIYLRIEGNLKGEAMFIFPEKGGLELIDLMLGKPPGTTKSIDETMLGESAFTELATILTSAFLNAMSRMLDVTILPSPPHVATDFVQSLVDMLLIEVGTYADSFLSVGTKIEVSGYNINGKFLILFDRDSLLEVLDRLHDKFG